MKGFTLLEILLIILIVIFLAALTIPLGLNFYKNQQLYAHTQGILQTLRRAQVKATSVELDSNFGVYITNDNYTLFKGNFYEEVDRDTQYDEIFDLPRIITVSGLLEVVFLKFEGNPSVTGNISINSDGQSRTININEVGRINLE